MANTKKKEFNRMRMVHIRIHLDVNSREHGLLHYTLDDIEKFVARYDSACNEIAWALHNKDKSEYDIHVLCKPHVHIVMRYLTDGSSYDLSVIKKEFPECKIYERTYKESCFAYLIHANEEDEYHHHYSVDEVHFAGAMTRDIYEEYVAISKLKKAEKKAKDEAAEAAKSAASASKEKYAALNLDMIVQKAADAEEAKQLHALYCKVRDEIWDGTITRRKYNNLLESDTAYRDMHDKHKAKIDDTFNRRRTWMIDHYKDRSLKVIFIEGNGSGGKTELAKMICDQMNWSYSVSSEKNDIFQDVLEDDDVFIFNEVTDSMCEYRTFNRWLDPFVNPSLGSRFYNKNFFGHTIIITTPKTIDQWYTGKNMADGDYEGQSTRVQFDRRIHKLIKVRGDFVEEYDHHEDGSNTFVNRYLNPVKCRKEKNKEEKQSHAIDNLDLQAVFNHSAKHLDVVDRYEQYKATTDIDELAKNYYDKLGEMLNKEADNELDCHDLLFDMSDALKSYHVSKQTLSKLLIKMLSEMDEKDIPIDLMLCCLKAYTK